MVKDVPCFVRSLIGDNDAASSCGLEPHTVACVGFQFPGLSLPSVTIPVHQRHQPIVQRL